MSAIPTATSSAPSTTPRRAAELAESAGQLRDHVVLPDPHAVHVHGGLCEGHAQLRGLARLVHHVRDVQERLRGDAAAVEADAAGVGLRVDERDVQPLLRGQERGGVAAGARAQDGDAQRCVGHANPPAP